MPNRDEIASHSLGRYGEIRYTELPRGHIKIVNNFVQDFLVKADLPFVGGKKMIHRMMLDPLVSTLETIEEFCQWDSGWEYIEGLSIFNPRHQWYKSNKPLSRHAFALAVDVNHWENLPGTRGTIPMHIVELFERNGFLWGGRWKKSDPMHFQLKLQKANV
jgi:hypothetical protein